MNPNTSHEEPQVNRTLENELHYVEHHDFSPGAFAVQGETPRFNGIRVIDEAGTGEFEDFVGFDEVEESDWIVDWLTAAKLSDGTILYEGQR